MTESAPFDLQNNPMKFDWFLIFRLTIKVTFWNNIWTKLSGILLMTTEDQLEVSKSNFFVLRTPTLEFNIGMKNAGVFVCLLALFINH